MYGHELLPALTAAGVTKLHHANTVLTSCTFLRLGGLAARGYVERHRLAQTPQKSDREDKKFGIWHDIFVDHVDIHDRASNVCFYGPVLFVFPVEMLANLPDGTEVHVARANPMGHWSDNDTNGERYYLTPDAVAANLTYGDFDKPVMIRTPDSFVPFPQNPVQVILDSAPGPILNPGDMTPSYDRAKARLEAVGGPVPVSVTARGCHSTCRCHANYAARADMRFWFDT